MISLSPPRQKKFRGLESNQHWRVQSPSSYPLDDPGIKGVSWAGFEPAISGLKDRRPLRRHHQDSTVHRAGVEPAQPGGRVGYSHGGSPVPSRCIL